jgi:hypothetical protein
LQKVSAIDAVQHSTLPAVKKSQNNKTEYIPPLPLKKRMRIAISGREHASRVRTPLVEFRGTCTSL